MPELPEVETVRAGLSAAVTGATVESVEVVDARALAPAGADPDVFAAALTGRTITGAARRGKFLWFPLDAETALVTHLGMSGQLLLRDAGGERLRSLRVRFAIEHSDHSELFVDFIDQRIFGWLRIDRLVDTADRLPGGFYGSAEVAPEWLNRIPVSASHIARDPLDAAFDDEAFFQALTKKRTTLKRALLDQRLVSGVGNIYADEALWAARLHYDLPTLGISRQTTFELLGELRAVLERAVLAGGTSFDGQYLDVNGDPGYFVHSLHAYGRENQPCQRCGAIMVREKWAGRSSHFCPNCQRLTAKKAS